MRAFHRLRTSCTGPRGHLRCSAFPTVSEVRSTSARPTAKPGSMPFSPTCPMAASCRYRTCSSTRRARLRAIGSIIPSCRPPWKLSQSRRNPPPNQSRSPLRRSRDRNPLHRPSSNPSRPPSRGNPSSRHEIAPRHLRLQQRRRSRNQRPRPAPRARRRNLRGRQPGRSTRIGRPPRPTRRSNAHRSRHGQAQQRNRRRPRRGPRSCKRRRFRPRPRRQRERLRPGRKRNLQRQRVPLPRAPGHRTSLGRRT